MNHDIVRTSEQTSDFLSGFCTGTVHSVYQNTVNLRFSGHLLSLQVSGSVLSPISLITDLSPENFRKLDIAEEDPAFLQSGEISVRSSSGTCSFTCRQAEIVDLSLPAAIAKPLSESALSFLESQIAEALAIPFAKSQYEAGFQPLFSSPRTSSSVLLQTAGRIMNDSSSLFHEECFHESAVSLARLLGLGIGLTPSGDDFLCGALAGLLLSGREEHFFAYQLRREILRRLQDTGDISAAFLSCAAEGLFSLPVISLADLPDSEKIFSDFRRIGHSSGFDTLCGVLYGLRLK